MSDTNPPTLIADQAHGAVQQRVREIEKARLADSSREGYIGQVVLMFIYLLQHHPECITDKFRELMNDEGLHITSSKLKHSIRKLFVESDILEWPLTDSFTVSIFKEYIASQCHEDGKPLGHAALSNKRSALGFLFTEWHPDHKMPQLFATEVSQFYAGTKRVAAKEAQMSGNKVVEGKKKLDFRVYIEVAKSLWKKGSEGKCNLITVIDNVLNRYFSLLFLTLLWNLLSRAKNIQNLNLGHITWEDDSLVIYFAQSKTDQEGNNAENERHVYANPLQPLICPVLALAVYTHCVPNSLDESQTGDSKSLFDGPTQYNRYNSMLRKVLLVMIDLLARFGLVPSDIGSHSVRKGASSFCTSGSTAGPGIVSVCLRAGWTIGDVLSRYIKPEGAGDQFTSRTVAGLPPDDPEFATLPPFFEDMEHEAIDRILNVCFPSLTLLSHSSLLLAFY